MNRNSFKAAAEISARDLQCEIEMKYPDLTVGKSGTKVYIRGAFPIVHEGRVLDRYQIEIEWSDSDIDVPLVRETAGRIPWIADRHMSQGGLACLFVPEEWLMRPREERVLIRYLDGPVRNFFLWQSLVEQGESAPWGERAHGVPGLIEAYGDMLEMEGESAIRQCLEYLSKEEVKGHWACPCGSGKRIRHCHREHLRNLRSRIPRHIARLALKRLTKPVMI